VEEERGGDEEDEERSAGDRERSEERLSSDLSVPIKNLMAFEEVGMEDLE